MGKMFAVFTVFFQWFCKVVDMTVSFLSFKWILNIFYIAVYAKYWEIGLLFEGKPPAVKAIYFMATYVSVSFLEESLYFLLPFSPRTNFSTPVWTHVDLATK